MEFTTQIVNISKIKEGFYIGDRATGLNLDLLIQFKITHMINSSGNRLINAFETIGIKYLTLNWAENNTQSLFDSKDNIVDIIVSFIDNALNNGEGLLAHSVRGQNRVCVVVIIYLMKKYKWGLMKCIDFLHSKKADVDVPKYFLTQLKQFESRLAKEGIPQSMGWSDNGTINDNDEKLMINTYVNGLLLKQNNSASSMPSYYQSGKRVERQQVGWGDCNPYKNTDTLIHSNKKKDLLLQKEVKPVTNHMRLMPGKTCLKQSKSYNNLEYGRINSNYTANTSVNSNINASFIKIQEVNKNIMNNNHNNGLTPNFPNQHLNNRNVSPLKQTTDSFNNNNLGNFFSKERLNNHLNNNYCDEDSNSYTFYKRNNSYTNKNKTLPKDIINLQNSLNENINIDGNDIMRGYKRDSFLKKDNLNSNEKNKRNANGHNKKGGNNFLVNLNSNNDTENINASYQKIKKENKLSVSEDQNIMKNNFIDNYNNYSAIDNKLLKIINSNSTQGHIVNPYEKTIIQKKNQMSMPIGMNSSYQPKIMKMREENHKNPHFTISQNKPLNNFDPSLMKNGQNIFNRPRSGTNHQVPITLPKDFINKPLTPDHTLHQPFNPEKNKVKLQSNNNHLYGSIQRQPHNNHYQQNNINAQMLIRPSTAPQKDKHKQAKTKQYQPNNNINNSLNVQHPFQRNLNRLPSPMIKSTNLSQQINYSQQKYRSPSPMIKSSFGQPQYNISLIK